jgi:hypothetical protein
MYIISQMLKSSRRTHLRHNQKKVFRQYYKKFHSYSDPPINKKEAYRLLTKLLQDLPEREATQIRLDERAKEKLKDLGYHPE